MSNRTSPPSVDKVRQAYDGLVASGAIGQDPAQLELVGLLDRLLHRISEKRLSSKSSALGWLFAKRSGKPEPLKGLYVWGGVGRGKSMLMDMFFEHLPHARKKRVHFNDFMQDAQERIHAHRQAFGRGETRDEDPIPGIAREIAASAAVLCFDEFTVTDIADAMILGRLFEGLFHEGVVVVATSNVAPVNLYPNGLNRKIFLPFIDVLLAHVDVVELSARTDFRLEKLNRAEVYLHPRTNANAALLETIWIDVTGGVAPRAETIPLKGRVLEVPKAASGAAWFRFKTLCEEPRSAEDFLAIARRFHTVFIEGIPVMEREQQNAAKRFILLIDTLYDNHVRVVVLAEAEPSGLYTATSGTEAFEFARTASRLNEMQSVEYMAGGGRNE